VSGRFTWNLQPCFTSFYLGFARRSSCTAHRQLIPRSLYLPWYPRSFSLFRFAHLPLSLPPHALSTPLAPLSAPPVPSHYPSNFHTPPCTIFRIILFAWVRLHLPRAFARYPFLASVDTFAWMKSQILGKVLVKLPLQGIWDWILSDGKAMGVRLPL
jgi:hypothetical protein